MRPVNKGSVPRAHTMRPYGFFLSIVLLLLGTAGLAADSPKNELPSARPPKITSVAEALNLYGVGVRAKLKPLFKSMQVDYPPKEMTWICLKQEKQFYVFAKDKSGAQKCLLSYPIIGASGVAGPKLKEGDKQVPEGFYKLFAFRPNVIAHLGLAVDYPNKEDRDHAQKEGRFNLGKDILIHGSRWSTGCLAMGNPPIEELFVLAHDSGLDSISLIFAPCNLNSSQPDVDFKTQPSWLPALYKKLRLTIAAFPFNSGH